MSAERDSAIRSLTYLVRSVLATPEVERVRVVGPNARPWCELLERVTRSMSADLRAIVVPLLVEVTRAPEALTEVQRALVGTAARRLLQFAWGAANRDRGMVYVGTQAVCRTFASDPAASRAVLGRILEPEPLASHGFEDLPTLTQELPSVLASSPAFAEEVYRAAVSYRETDRSSTTMSDSVILPLTSNRRQDYQMALYSLGKLFPRFMAEFPVEATGAVIAAVEAAFAEKAIVPLAEIPDETFAFGQFTGRIIGDGSSLWDVAHRSRDELHHAMLDAFESELIRLASAEGDAERLAEVLNRVARDNRYSALWRRVLSAGARAPQALGRQVWRLATAPPVLAGADTGEPMGRFIRAVHPILAPDEREAIENAITTLHPAGGDPAAERRYGRRRDMLIGCLSPGEIVSDTARQRLADLRAAGGPPADQAPYSIGEPTREEYTTDDWLAEQGVDLDEEPNRRMRELTAPATNFSSQFRNNEPTPEQAVSALPQLRALHEALTTGSPQGDERVLESGWTALAESAEVLARSGWVGSNPGVKSFARAVLLDAAQSAFPRPDPRRDEGFEQHGGICPTPRWHSASGLLVLARVPGTVDADVLGAIGRLAADPCTEVRAEVARHLFAIETSAPDLFWQLLRQISNDESSPKVVLAALAAVLPFALKHRVQLVPLAHTVFNRFREGSRTTDLRNLCLSLVTRADARSEAPFGDELIRTVVGDITGFQDEIGHLVVLVADRLTVGPVAPPDPVLERLRIAAFGQLVEIGTWVHTRIGELDSRLRGCSPADLTQDDRDQIKTVREIADELATRVYFASGAFEEPGQDGPDSPEKLSPEARLRFLREAEPLINLLADLPFADVTHRLLEMLVRYAEVNPRTVFLSAERALRKGQEGGYQFEPLGAGLVVSLVRRYLADYRFLFREDADCRNALTAILNTFVKAGWPEAFNLTLRLEEIYR